MRLPKKWNETDWLIYQARIDMGLPWREVGKRLKRSPEWCRQRLLTRLEQLPHHDLEAYRQQELERLDTREARATHIYAQAMANEPDLPAALAAIKRANEITSIRAKLLGLNAPTNIDVEHSVSGAAASLDELLEAFQAGADAALPVDR